MKKKLLTAAIFSASCLFASAYTLESAAGYWGENGSSKDVTKQDNDDGGFTLTGTGLGFTSATANRRDELTFSFTIDCSSFDLESSSNIYFFHFDGNQGDLGVGYRADRNYLTMFWNGTPYQTNAFGVASPTGVQTFTVSFGDSGTRVWDSQGNFWSSNNLKGNIDNGEISTIVFSASGASAIDSLIVWDKDIDYGSDSGKATAIAAAKLAQSVVPEPSAFGLLAGLGALSLVASRRRRR